MPCAPRFQNNVSAYCQLFRRSRRGSRQSPKSSVATPEMVRNPNGWPGIQVRLGGMSIVRSLVDSWSERLKPTRRVFNRLGEKTCWYSRVTYWFRERSLVFVTGTLTVGGRSTLPLSKVYRPNRKSFIENR